MESGGAGGAGMEMQGNHRQPPLSKAMATSSQIDTIGLHCYVAISLRFPCWECGSQNALAVG